MLCHIIVPVVHEPSHKWRESLFCVGFWPGCRSLWHRHAGAGFKNDTKKFKLIWKVEGRSNKQFKDGHEFENEKNSSRSGESGTLENVFDQEMKSECIHHFREDWLVTL